MESESTNQTSESTGESKQESSEKQEDGAKVEYKPETESFVPEEFKNEPIKYFEDKGKNVKNGEIKHHEDGTVREDPTAVKDFPEWENPSGEKIKVVGKRVNAEKAQVGQTGDPFHEYKVMELVTEVGLPAPRPIAKAEQNNQYLFVMERATGIRWNERTQVLRESGMSEEDIENWQQKAREKMQALGDVFEEYGIKRGWKEQDMIFDIDEQTKEIKKITPTDWERTKIDLEVYNKKKKEVTKEGLTVEDLLLTPDERIKKLDGEIEQKEKEIAEATDKAEQVRLAIEKTHSELGIEPSTETAPSIERITEEIDKLKKKKDDIEERKEKIKKEKEMQKLIEEETMRLLKEKIEEFFQILSQLSESELENISSSGNLSNGNQLELSDGLKIPNEIASGLVQAYKEKITDTEEVLNRFPAIKQAKSTLRKEAKNRVETGSDHAEISKEEITEPKPLEQQIFEQSNLIEIKTEDRNVEGKLLVSPEGPVSKLDEQEWKMVRTEAFKEWFGASMVVDENGEPLVLYHGSSKKFDKFDISKVGASSGENKDSGYFGKGFYFTPHEGLAEKYGPVLYKSFLRINRIQTFSEDHGNVRFDDSPLPENIREEVLRRYKPLQEAEYKRLKEEEEKTKGQWVISSWNGTDKFEHILSDIVREVLLDKGFDGVMGYNQVSKLYEYTAFNQDDILVISQEEKSPQT
ncbi:MAG: hypothetical protein WCO16_03685 [bacterium]